MAPQSMWLTPVESADSGSIIMQMHCMQEACSTVLHFLKADLRSLSGLIFQCVVAGGQTHDNGRMQCGYQKPAMGYMLMA